MASNFAVPDLVELYSKPYDDKMLAWREAGARDKAANIAAMTAGLRGSIGNVLEVGCGSGIVLEKLAERGVGRDFTGIEITDGRVATARQVAGAAIRIEPYDGKTIPFPDESFDLVYATHVLEHVTEPRRFLHELRRVARRHVYIEVPCEMTARASHKTLQPTLNIGHINGFTPMSLELMLETSGLVVRDVRVLDASFAVHAFWTNPLKARVKMGLRRAALALGGRLAASLFAYNCGALCEKGERLNID